MATSELLKDAFTAPEHVSRQQRGRFQIEGETTGPLRQLRLRRQQEKAAGSRGTGGISRPPWQAVDRMETPFSARGSRAATCEK